jgi:hypothetical protein
MVRPSGDTSTCIHVTSSVVNSIVSAVFSVKPSAGLAVSSCAGFSWPCSDVRPMAHSASSVKNFFMRGV